MLVFNAVVRLNTGIVAFAKFFEATGHRQREAINEGKVTWLNQGGIELHSSRLHRTTSVGRISEFNLADDVVQFRGDRIVRFAEFFLTGFEEESATKRAGGQFEEVTRDLAMPEVEGGITALLRSDTDSIEYRLRVSIGGAAEDVQSVGGALR
jgi:hypothetical protein